MLIYKKANKLDITVNCRFEKRVLKFRGIISPAVPRETILSVLKNVYYARVVGGLFSFEIRA
jgi:hypothetical protein